MTAELQYSRERETTLTLLRLLNDRSQRQDLIAAVTGFMRTCTGCEAVGIRLREGDDFPYFETRGFSEEFVEAERHLCAHTLTGTPLHDSAGIPVLECMCGNVIQGRTDPTLPFFTPKGSFWSNGTTALLAATTEVDRQARTRNRCNGEGYESVALVPLQHGQRTLGLMQFNDRRPNRFTPELIAFLERLADQVAIALAQRETAAALVASETRIHHLNQLLRAIRSINSLIVRERDAQRILDEACQILIKTRGYAMVWISRITAGTSRLEPVARAGDASGYTEKVTVTVDAGPTGSGPLGRAFRTRSATVCQDIATDPSFAPWRDDALARGYRAAACAPLVHGDRLFGALSVYADRPDAFVDDEVQLLTELAADLAFALMSLEGDEERRRAEEQIRAQAALLDLAQDAILVRDLDDRIWYWNQGAELLLGWPQGEVVGRPVTELFIRSLPAVRGGEGTLAPDGGLVRRVGPEDEGRARSAREQSMDSGARCRWEARVGPCHRHGYHREAAS